MINLEVSCDNSSYHGNHKKLCMCSCRYVCCPKFSDMCTTKIPDWIWSPYNEVEPLYLLSTHREIGNLYVIDGATLETEEMGKLKDPHHIINLNVYLNV